jgi:hypothetical protein
VFSLRLHIVAGTRHFSHSIFSAHDAELRRFAAKNVQTIEDNREKFSGAVKSLRGTTPQVIASPDCKRLRRDVAQS